MAYRIETVQDCRYEIDEVDHTDKVCELVAVERTACPIGCCVIGSDDELTVPGWDEAAGIDYGEVRPMFEVFNDVDCALDGDPGHTCDPAADDDCASYTQTPARWQPLPDDIVARLVVAAEEEFFEYVRMMIREAEFEEMMAAKKAMLRHQQDLFTEGRKRIARGQAV